MSVITAVILGLVQALGEFLPISSSAHLVLVPYFGAQSYQGVAFDTALHLATLLALITYFWRDLLSLTRAGLTAPRSDNGRLFWYIGLATVPAGLAGFLLQDTVETHFRSPLLIAAMLVIFACVLMYADKRKPALKRTVFALGPMMLIGCAQALALMPGVSRSGVTISAALLLGFGRAAGARISFLLSIPVIAGAAVLEFKDMPAANIDAPLAAGFLTALICGFLVIKFLMKFIQGHNFDVFVYYRWALGAAIIALYFGR